jgi:hypothetical protein
VSEGTQPDRGGQQEGGHRHHRGHIVHEIGHESLLFRLCTHFVLFLFDRQRHMRDAPDGTADGRIQD